MSIIIHDELQDVQNHCEAQINGSKIIACVPSMVRVDIIKTKFKQVTACLQFPENYPKDPLLIELKSKTLVERFLTKLTEVCEVECKKQLGKPQILIVLKFLRLFLEENPLCVCSEELAFLKRELNENDELKLKQKTSSLILHITQDYYFLKVKVIVPDTYPEQQVELEIKECNFPEIFQKWFLAQSKEIARQCVQKPFKSKPKDPPFQPKPSLWPTVRFLIAEVKKYPCEACQLCKEKCFPDDAQSVINNRNDGNHIERVYCGHIFHSRCLDTYMKTPPFHEGKKCPTCKQIIYHEKWKIAPKLAEEKWAHKEAKKRELSEVVEFLQ